MPTNWHLQAATADHHWSLLAPVVAGRPKVRISLDGGQSYTRTRTLTTRRPLEPAAVVLFDERRELRCLAFDLDASRGDVTRDHARLRALLDTAGLGHFADVSPSGGRHVYAPLAVPLDEHRVARLARALRAELPTLDIAPLLNPVSGCLRPPGASHGTQRPRALLGGLSDALHVANHPAAPHTVTALEALLGLPSTSAAPVTPNGSTPERLRTGKPLTGIFATLARDGLAALPQTRYPSASEARLAVVAAARSRGWSFTAIAAALNAGDWPGLHELYTHRRATPGRLHRSLSRDWDKTARPAPKHSSSTKRLTREPNHTPPPPSPPQTITHREHGTADDFQHIRTWQRAVDHAPEFATPHGHTVQAVLLALAGAAQRTHTSAPAVGVRSLAIATGLSLSTVTRVLAELRDATDAWIDRLEIAQGIHADRYQLRLPDRYASATTDAWPAGNSPQPPPLFRSLGLSSWHVYRHTPAAGQGQQRSTEHIAQRAGVHPETARRHLLRLHAYGLITHTDGHWAHSPDTDARRQALEASWGCDQLRDAQIAQYRAQRRAWRAWLETRPPRRSATRRPPNRGDIAAPRSRPVTRRTQRSDPHTARAPDTLDLDVG